MVATIRLFVTVGKGTLAPWEPPQRLVVQGVYRHVRNPMISGVLCVLLGESVLTASLPLFRWFLVVRHHQRHLHPALGGAWARQSIWRGVPDLQTERAEVDSEAGRRGTVGWETHS